MPRLRCFISVPTPAPILERITALMTAFRSVPSDVKWEHAEKLHITLKFLGSIEESLVQPLVDQLNRRLRAVSAFEFQYEGIGAFPSLHEPRIIWIGTSENHSLTHLHETVEDVTRSNSIANDDRPFHPHVTIGRVKSSRGINLLTARVKSVTFEPAVARCSEILMMKSELLPAGSQYTVLSRIPLNR